MVDSVSVSLGIIAIIWPRFFRETVDGFMQKSVDFVGQSILLKVKLALCPIHNTRTIDGLEVNSSPYLQNFLLQLKVDNLLFKPVVMTRGCTSRGVLTSAAAASNPEHQIICATAAQILVYPNLDNDV